MLLYLFAFGLVIFIVRSVARTRSFTVSDALAALGIIIAVILAQGPFGVGGGQAQLPTTIVPTAAAALSTASPVPSAPATLTPAPVAPVVTTEPAAANVIAREHVTQLAQIAQFGNGKIVGLAYGAEGSLAVASSTGVMIYDAVSYDTMRFIPAESALTSIAITLDGTRVAAGARDGTAREWDLRTGDLLQTYSGHSAQVNSVAYSPDAGMLASGSDDDMVRVWRTSDAEPLLTLGGDQGHVDNVRSVAFSPDGGLVASGGGSKDKTLRVWRVRDGALLHILTHDESVNSVSFSPVQSDDVVLLSGTSSKKLWIWSAARGVELRPALEAHTSTINAMAFSADGSRLATVAHDATVRLWNTADWSVGEPWQGHRGGIAGVAFAPDGLTVASGAWADTVRVWRASDGQLLHTFAGYLGAITRVALSPDGRRLAVGSYDNTVNLLDLTTQTLERRLEGQAGDITSVSFSDDGSQLATGAYNGSLRLWRTTNWEFVEVEKAHKGSLVALAFAPGANTVLASGSSDKTLKRWDTEATELPPNFVHREGLTSLSYSTDGTRIVTGARDGQIRLWDGSSGALISNVEQQVDTNGNGLIPNSIAFIPGSQTKVVAGYSNGSLILWAVDGDEPQPLLESRTSCGCGITTLAVSPDGELIAAGGDSSGKIWIVATDDWTTLREISGHLRAVLSLAFSSDGTFLVSGGDDGTVRVWSRE